MHYPERLYPYITKESYSGRETTPKICVTSPSGIALASLLLVNLSYCLSWRSYINSSDKRALEDKAHSQIAHPRSALWESQAPYLVIMPL